MAKRKKQYYVVVRGRQPGIYKSWYGEDGAAVQVQGVPDARYRGFYTAGEARAWLAELGATDLLEALDAGVTGPVAPGQDATSSGQDAPPADRVVIYTDGGALGNPGPGGYGVVLQYGERRKELSGGFRRTTNNRMELLACIEALRALKGRYPVVLYTDSQYVSKGLTRGWARRWRANDWCRKAGQPAKNVDLWAPLLRLYERHDVDVRWVRGHAGVPENERCDQLAKAAASRADLPPDVPYERGLTQRPPEEV
jgi:ribonuclease HI